jgi:hypothetical protein
MTPEDEEFNRIEREAKQRMEAVSTALKDHRQHMEETIRYRDAFPKDYRLPRPWVGLTDDEMDAVVYSNITITDSKLRDAVYAVVIDTITTLKEKNNG